MIQGGKSVYFGGKTQQLILGTVAGDCPRDKTPKRKTMEFSQLPFFITTKGPSVLLVMRVKSHCIGKQFWFCRTLGFVLGLLPGNCN